MSKPKNNKKENNTEESIPNLINISSTEESECKGDDTKGNSQGKNGKEFLYYTPFKKQRLNYIPSTPKKPNKAYHYEGLVGRNLTMIFETMDK